MVLTALLLCLQPAKNKPNRTWTTIRAFTFGLAIIAFSALTGCGPGGNSGDGPIVTTTPNSGNGGSSGGGGGTSSGSGGSPPPATSGVSASLAWDPVPDSSVIGYFVHYGTQSSNFAGSCAYAQSTFSSSPSATVTGLAPNTTYYFAVSAYNGLESACSSEVAAVTGSI
ncbi:fibronectin type III domain-containing protein [Petrachloros mirabilis]